MGSQDDEFFHWRMQPGHSYLSKQFPADEYGGRLMRYVTRVIDSDYVDAFEVESNEIVIRQTTGGRQEIKAVFFEDNRQIERLIFQRFTGSNPSTKQHFSFRGDEIDEILWLAEVARRTELNQASKTRFSDKYLREISADNDELLRFLRLHRESLAQLEGVDEIVHYLEFRRRRQELRTFESLLYNEAFFQEMKQQWGKARDEAVWQHFFEHNPWVFGLGLAPVFLSNLKDKGLEQVVSGFNVTSEGKRVDALMRTNGVLSSLCFVEIKTPKTRLLHSSDYRSGAWSISGELAGAVAQCHTTIQAAMDSLETKIATKDQSGNPTGELTYLYQPRSYLVVGCLGEFVTEYGANDSKYRSFELCRRNLRSPEIVTYDELLERARATVEGSVGPLG